MFSCQHDAAILEPARPAVCPWGCSCHVHLAHRLRTAVTCRHVLQDYTERRALRAELKALQKEERQRQQRAVEEVLKVGCFPRSWSYAAVSAFIIQLCLPLVPTHLLMYSYENLVWSGGGVCLMSCLSVFRNMCEHCLITHQMASSADARVSLAQARCSCSEQTGG